jgi:hypothetical protein
MPSRMLWPEPSDGTLVSYRLQPSRGCVCDYGKYRYCIVQLPGNFHFRRAVLRICPCKPSDAYCPNRLHEMQQIGVFEALSLENRLRLVGGDVRTQSFEDCFDELIRAYGIGYFPDQK